MERITVNRALKKEERVSRIKSKGENNMYPKNKNFSSNNTVNTEKKETPRFIYRVLVKVGYHDNGYDFEFINDAVDFMKTVILHAMDQDDTEVTMQIVELKEEEGKEKEEDE
jgi:hypothetical protein